MRAKNWAFPLVTAAQALVFAPFTVNVQIAFTVLALFIVRAITE